VKFCIFTFVPFKVTGQDEFRSESAEFFILVFYRFLLVRCGYFRYKTSGSYIFPQINRSQFGRYFDHLKYKFLVTKCYKASSFNTTNS
jgi:hypothetical protein